MDLYHSFQDMLRDLCLFASLCFSLFLLLLLYVSKRATILGTIVEGRLFRLERQAKQPKTGWYIINRPGDFGVPISDG